MTKYRSQAAREAQAQGYGTESYWDYLECRAFELHGFYRAKGDWKAAEKAFTNSLTCVLQGNDGI